MLNVIKLINEINIEIYLEQMNYLCAKQDERKVISIKLDVIFPLTLHAELQMQSPVSSEDI